MTAKQSEEQPTDQIVDATKMVPPTTLSEERLRELKALYSKATPGDWEITKHNLNNSESLEHEHGIYPPLGESGPVALVSGPESGEFIVALHNAFPSLLHAAEQMARYQWQPIESAPKNQKVIAGYHNCLGKWRTITACYYVHGTLEAEDCSVAEFAKEGWYEESDSHETLLMTDCPPTHWMPLPPAPEKGGQGA